jgi:hypothetical protein
VEAEAFYRTAAAPRFLSGVRVAGARDRRA